LILDEPTNYLDIPSVIWLQGYLSDLTETTVVIVAHDRAFLDAVTTETIVLRNMKLSYFEGSISEYERATMKKRKSDMKQKAALDHRKAALEKSISDGAKQARKSGDDKKAQQFKCKQKKLDERWGLEKNEKGHRLVCIFIHWATVAHTTNRFKLQRDFAGCKCITVLLTTDLTVA
jgi:ATP-binding cassette, subfamily F, member 3